MLYFDTSAIVSFFMEDTHSLSLVRYLQKISILSASSSMITPLEFESALQRRLNAKEVNLMLAEKIRDDFLKWKKRIDLIPFDENSLRIAAHVQSIYSLRPGDSIQLAAALICHNNPGKVAFICFDEKLNLAAIREGFEVIFS